MEAHQAPPSLGFSRQEHWSGLPFPSPMHESEVSQSCPTLRDPMDGRLPGSSVHGIFQARILEWGVIAFSEATVCRVLKSQDRSNPAHIDASLSACGSSAPLRVDCEGGAAVWLAATLEAPSRRNTDCLHGGSYGPIRVFFRASCSW